MTSNVGASVIEKGGRNFGFFLRPDDEEQENVGYCYLLLFAPLRLLCFCSGGMARSRGVWVLLFVFMPLVSVVLLGFWFVPCIWNKLKPLQNNGPWLAADLFFFCEGFLVFWGLLQNKNCCKTKEAEAGW